MLREKPKSNGEWVYITSEQARDIPLARNRKRTELRIKKYSRNMKEGTWNDHNPQPIMKNTRGELCDGQHRIMALARTDGLGFWFYLMEGVEDDTLLFVDDGSSRSDPDALEIDNVVRGKPIDKNMRQNIKIWKFAKFTAPINKAMFSRPELKHDLETPEVIEAINWARKDMPREFRQSALLGPMAAAYFAGEDKELLQAFKDVFISGGDVCHDEKLLAAYTLKKHIETGKVTTAKSRGLHTANNGNTYFQHAVWLYLGLFLRGEVPPKQLRDDLVNKTVSPWIWGGKKNN